MTKANLQKVLFGAIILACLFKLIAAPVALICGILFTFIFGQPYPAKTSKFSSLLLKISVVGLGFGMNIHSATAATKDSFWLTVCSISTILIFGYFIGRAFKLPRPLSHLISSGTAICGGSAIAAIAPAINAKQEQISISLGVVFLLNSVALLVFPVFGHLIDMTQHQFGLWCAIAIHDTSSVVGAASAYGEEALKIATTVKLARALWIIPISILSAALFRNKNNKLKIPYFIFFFILVVIANTYLPFLSAIAPRCVDISSSLLVVTLFLIGTSLSFESLKRTGIKPLIQGVTLWFYVAIMSLCAIMFLN